MTREQVAHVLAVAAAYDRRQVGETDVRAWLEASVRGRWRYETAVEEVHEHFAASTAWLMPGHITAFHRANPVRPCDTPAAELVSRSEPASRSVREAAMREIRGLAAKWSL